MGLCVVPLVTAALSDRITADVNREKTQRSLSYKQARPLHSGAPPPPSRALAKRAKWTALGDGDGNINCTAGAVVRELGQAPAAEVGEDEECCPRLPTSSP